MSHHMSLDAGAASSFDDTEVSSRGRWATIVAVVMVIVHFLVVFVILGWHYYVVPRAKFDFDNLGQPLSGSTIMVIHQSDFVVNYWYLFFGAGPFFLAFDFYFIRYVGKEIGLWMAIALGAIITFIYLAYLVSGVLAIRH